MDPLSIPHVGCVTLPPAVILDEGFTVKLVLLVQPDDISVTVTLYVPGPTFNGFCPLKLPVHAYVAPVLGVTLMDPLSIPHVGCVTLPLAVIFDEGFTVKLVLLVQPDDVSVTVTVYVPGPTFNGFCPLKPPVHAYVPPVLGVTLMDPLSIPHVGCVTLPPAVIFDEGFTVKLVLFVQPDDVSVTVTVYVPGPTFNGFCPLKPPVHAYVPPVLGVTLMDPLSIPHVGCVTLPLAVIVTFKTVDCAVLVQPLFVTVTL
jgi:hypothetical protein